MLPRLLTSGQAPRRALVSGYLEVVKYAALGAMLASHVAQYAYGVDGGWAHVVGRLAFPMFTAALALGCVSEDALRRTMWRLVGWGVVAQVGSVLVRGPLPLNVLFTFALGVVLYVGVARNSLGAWVSAAAALLIGMACEFGFVGVALVAVALAAGRTFERYTGAPRYIAALAVVGMLCALCAFNGDGWALLAVPVLFGLALFEGLPRVRHLFYVVYAAQWFALAAAGVVGGV
jgi:hypothetical protein